jgi:hypothetical protein
MVKLRKIKLGKDYPDTLGSINNLAIDYSKTRQRIEVLQLTEEIVKLRKIKLRKDYFDILASTRFLIYISQKIKGFLLSSEILYRPRHFRLNFL